MLGCPWKWSKLHFNEPVIETYKAAVMRHSLLRQMHCCKEWLQLMWLCKNKNLGSTPLKMESLKHIKVKYYYRGLPVIRHQFLCLWARSSAEQLQRELPHLPAVSTVPHSVFNSGEARWHVSEASTLLARGKLTFPVNVTEIIVTVWLQAYAKQIETMCRVIEMSDQTGWGMGQENIWRKFCDTD